MAYAVVVYVIIPRLQRPINNQMAGGTRDQFRCFDGQLQQYIDVLSRERDR